MRKVLLLLRGLLLVFRSLVFPPGVVQTTAQAMGPVENILPVVVT